jgi:hypothetical protein
MQEKLIFVYNANSGKTNAILDVYHKIASPKTYQCNLCKLTHGLFTERKIWNRFKKSLNAELQFLHVDEFRAQYKSKFGHKFTFPIVLVNGETGLEVFIATKELNKLKNTNELMQLVKDRLDS